MLKRVLIAAIRFYQRFLSPLKRVPTCRFLPTCSSYAIEAIQRRGAAVGTLMALWRILRCNPLFPGGFDPVEPYELPCPAHAHEAPGEGGGSSGGTNRVAPEGAAPTEPRMRPAT